jgi:hypothetical protein
VRDLAALRFVGEQYATRLDVLAVVLGRLSPAVVRDASRLGDRTVRQRVERWEAAGWAERRRMLGHTWVLVTRAGLRLAGLELDPWTRALDRLAHHHAAAIVRLAREPMPGQGWLCERELWRRRGKASWHMVDGALPAPVPTDWQGISEAWELVEVELHPEGPPPPSGRHQDPGAAHRRHHLLRPCRPASATVGTARQRGPRAGRSTPGHGRAAPTGARRHIHGYGG